MGRPLYTSILLARHATEAAAQPTPPTPTYPVVEKWSRWNAFDPDSDEFFEADNAVYEAFLSEEDIAERAQAQQRENARLLAERERLLRAADIIPGSSPISEDSDHSVAGNDATDTHISVAAQMETSDDMSDEGPRSTDDDLETQQSPVPEAQPPRRQPRRVPAIAEWRFGEISSNIPSISVIPAGSREVERASSLELFSGLELLSDSPRPFRPTDTPPGPISPIPNTPARVSGVFGTSPTSGQALTTPSPAPTVTPRVLTWTSQSIQFTPQWVPESPTPQDTSHFLGSLVPAPLTY